MNKKKLKREEKREERRELYQAKYEFYRRYAMIVISLSCIMSVTYFISDCQLFGRFAIETFSQRFSALAVMLIYLLIYRKCKNYKIMTVVGYLVIHYITWATIMSIYFLPDISYADSGFAVMEVVFFAGGFCAPAVYHMFFNSLLLADIAISGLFIPYADLSVLLSVIAPSVIGVCIVHFFMERIFRKFYTNQKMLDEVGLYDQLTGAHNRNILKQIVDEGTDSLTKEFVDPVSFVMFDIDHFKAINDRHGHQAGDKILVCLTNAIKSNMESKDCVIRWGGEEFLLIMPEKPLIEAVKCADAIRLEMQNHGNGVCPVTVSAGISVYNGVNYKKAVDEADKALLRAKELGRNRVEYIVM